MNGVKFLDSEVGAKRYNTGVDQVEVRNQAGQDPGQYLGNVRSGPQVYGDGLGELITLDGRRSNMRERRVTPSPVLHWVIGEWVRSDEVDVETCRLSQSTSMGYSSLALVHAQRVVEDYEPQAKDGVCGLIKLSGARVENDSDREGLRSSIQAANVLDPHPATVHNLINSTSTPSPTRLQPSTTSGLRIFLLNLFVTFATKIQLPRPSPSLDVAQDSQTIRTSQSNLVLPFHAHILIQVEKLQ
ncbi:hypothetical protein F5887DRAFT_919732 [Amanita rubescens]|nr:hypothetical protein F5887DRAFT_920620 [Amanita rubescens]KAF8339424.1 hypothetical protein F5887DRAFT_919732 [Amanita rubescens]